MTEPGKLFVDGRWTRVGTPDGITRFTANLVEWLHRVRPVTVLVHDERQLEALPDGVPHVVINSPLSPRELVLSRTLHRLGADVVFSPLQVIGGFRRRYRLIVTLHDLIYYRHPRPPHFLPLPVRILWRLYHLAYWPQRILLNRADAVVTVSETTKGLIERHRLTSRPVVVVPNAPAQPPRPGGGQNGHDGSDEAEGEAVGDGRDLVYMGAFLPHKNVETLIAGMAWLPEYRLHLLSPITPDRESELAELAPPGSDIVFWRGIEERDYYRLLEQAFALVTASREEGFGIPLVEALNAGAPVACSDLDIFHEVTGGHAAFFDPASPESFAAAVRRLEDETLRRQLISRGRRHAVGYSWESSANRLLELVRCLERADRGLVS